jgi:hypothetical protein
MSHRMRRRPAARPRTGEVLGQDSLSALLDADILRPLNKPAHVGPNDRLDLASSELLDTTLLCPL